MNTSNSAISAEFPFESKFININDSRIHYIEQGTGDPILFLHGMATSNYLWRNIIPGMSNYGRCIAPDLIGMGKSDKPDIAYRIFDYIRYIEQFIQALDLRNITLVLHGWGSLIGFDYARRHEGNIKALAFVEAYIRVLSAEMLTMPAQELLALLKHSEYGYKAIIEDNYLLQKVLPAIILRKLKPAELDYYKAAFPTPESRNLLWQYIQDLPIDGGAQDVCELLSDCSNWLQKTQLPKIMLYAIPGFVTPMSNVDWAAKHLPNLSIVDLGEAYHCPQETNPAVFSEALSEWYEQLPN